MLDTQHLDRFHAIAFGPDDRLATANEDGSVRIWDLRTGALVSVSQHPRLGKYIIALQWDGPRLGLLGEAWHPNVGSHTGTIDQLGNVLSEDTPAESSFFATTPHLAPDNMAVSVDRPGARFVFPTPPEVRSWVSPVFHASRDGRVLVAAPHASEVLVWSEPGRMPRHVSVGDNVGIRALALSQDGDHLAVAYKPSKPFSADASDVRTFFEPLTLALIETNKGGLPSVLSKTGSWTKIAFSPDGSRVAAINGDFVDVWTVADHRLVGTLRARRAKLAENGGPSFDLFADLKFSNDGHWLVCATNSGRLEVYAAGTLRRMHVLGAKVTPLNDAILIGDYVATIGPHSVNIWSISEATLEEQSVVPDVAGAYRDGDDLLVIRPAYDRVSCGKNERPVFHDRWHRLAKPAFYSSLLEFDRGEASDVALRTRDDLSKAITAHFGKPRCFPNAFRDTLVGQPEPVVVRQVDFVNYEMYDPSSGKTTRLERERASSGRRGSFLPQDVGFSAFEIQHDRYIYAIGGRFLKSLYVWDWKTGKLLRRLTSSGGATHFATYGDRVVVSGGKDIHVEDLGSGAKLRPIHLDDEVTALAIRSPQELLIGLLDGRLVVARDGTILAETKSSGGAIRHIRSDPLSERATTISADGSVRIWSLNPLRESIALVSYEDAEWITYTPRGAYHGTSEAAERVRWTFPNADSFRFEQFARLFDRPELVKQRAKGAPIDVDASPPHPPSLEAHLVSTTPRTARIQVTTHGAARVDRVAAFVEGRMIASANVCAQARTQVLEIPASGSTVAIAAFDSDGFASNTALVDLPPKVAPAKSDVWVVAAGIRRYPTLDAASQLQTADADARSISTAFSTLAGTHHPFAAAHIMPPLTNEQVSSASLKTELTKLASMKPDDLAIVFLAGHGIKLQESGESALLTSTAKERDAIRWTDISQAIDKLPGRVLVLLDACHAGHFTLDRIIANADLAGRFAQTSRAGVSVLAASKGRQMSYEAGGGARSIEVRVDSRSSSKHLDGYGVFTRAVVQSLVDPATDRNGNGVVDLDELIAAVTDRVETETQGLQTPWLSRRELFGSFTVVPGTADRASVPLRALDAGAASTAP